MQKTARKKNRVRKKQGGRPSAKFEENDEFNEEDSEAWRPAMTPRQRWVETTLAMLAALLGGVLYWWWRLDPRYEVTFYDDQGLKAGLLGWLLCVIIMVSLVWKGNREERKRLAAQRA